MQAVKPVEEVIAAHEGAGRRFEVDGVESFVRERGSGPAVVLVHGVPSSSFMYRKMLEPLADEGFRAIAFDFPGLGLADRPRDFDYSWTGLSRFMSGALTALEVDRAHLVVHDIGGPIGCEVAVRNPERILSLTALNCVLGVATFRRVWTMAPFAVPVLGRAMLTGTTRFAARRLFYMQALKERSAMTTAEIDAYQALLKRQDGGRAFLKIMRGFELTEEKQRLLWDGLADRPYPAQIIWGSEDPALGEEELRQAQRALDVDEPTLIPAKHFLQEDHAPVIAGLVSKLARSVS
jgi:pimeloyl-ACP methyl ester carboxylesterase